jgi:REP element-mobilizing transposase RayT
MKISIDNPLHYLTSVTKDRLQVFQTDKIKKIVAEALDEARTSSGIKIFAYVIMPDHIHLITDSSRKFAETQRYFNGVTARRVIDHLKENGLETSLRKLGQAQRSRNHRYSLWDHHPNAFSINNEKTLMQKVNYLHQNPVRAGLVERAEDYLYSSARIWMGRPLEYDPILVDRLF